MATVIELRSTVVGTRNMAKVYGPDLPIYRWVESVDDDGFASGGVGHEWHTQPGDPEHQEILEIVEAVEAQQ